MSPSALRREIGRLLIAGFDGQQVPVETRVLAREFGLGGVILFSRNIGEPEQVAELAYEASALDAGQPLWVSVDQEGGRVARLKAPFTEWPPMAALGRQGEEALAARFAGALAAELRAVGVTLDFAPVLDVLTNVSNPVIGDRALSADAGQVARLGRVLITSMQAAGVAACGKHFPGHGDTAVDSHLDLPVVDHPPDRLHGIEFVPFRAAIDAGVASIMTAHVLVPSLDDTWPATLSRPIVTGVLRDELRFDGLILSDDLEMKAIAARYSVPDAAVMAIGAGCDGVLICSGDYEGQAAALEAIVYAIENETLPLGRVETALARQRRVKERFMGHSPRRRPSGRSALQAMLGRLEHRLIADEMARAL